MLQRLLLTNSFLPASSLRSSSLGAVRNFGRKILCTDGVDSCCVDILQQRGFKVTLVPTLSQAELIKVIGDYDGLVVRSATKVNAEVLKHAGKMRIVGRAGVGVDNIDVAAATKQGIMVMNTPGGNTVSTAQLAMSLLTSLARHLPAADMSVKQGKWDRKSFTGVEITGKVLGVVGCGRIGQVVAASAANMGMQVIGYDPIMSASDFKEAGIKKVELAEIWAKSDFITLHTPLTAETKNLLNDTTLAKCKPGVRLVNCARGGIIDEDALLRALESGQVAGAALDVFTSEPPKENLKALLQHPNLVCTPHLGASTDEAQLNVARDIAVQMADVLQQRDFVGVMNVSYLAASTNQHIQPFMQLAETIGAMAAQLGASHPSPVKKVVLKTFGGRDVNITAKTARQLLEAKLLTGLIKHLRPGLVPDLISAPLMAKEAGIESVISDDLPDTAGSPYWNLVSVTVLAEDGSQACKVTGAVFGSTPHIVSVNDYSDLFAFRPEGNYILSFRNDDRPGAISEVLEILHDANVNIASLNVARAADNKALCFMALDDELSTKAFNAIRGLSFLHDVNKIQLR